VLLRCRSLRLETVIEELRRRHDGRGPP